MSTQLKYLLVLKIVNDINIEEDKEPRFAAQDQDAPNPEWRFHQDTTTVNFSATIIFETKICPYIMTISRAVSGLRTVLIPPKTEFNHSNM